MEKMTVFIDRETITEEELMEELKEKADDDGKDERV